jgi:hypothetical protein
MNPALDLAKLPPPARKVLDPSSPAPMRVMASKGVVPGLRPHDLVTVVAALTEDPDASLATTARATLLAFPPPILTGALSSDLEPGVIDVLAHAFATNDEVLEKLIAMPRIDNTTVAGLAQIGTERLTELIATNETRLLGHPVIIEKLYMNKRTRMSTADRLIELAVRNKIELHGIPAFREAAQALADELIPEPSDEPSPDDLAFNDADAIARQLDKDPAIAEVHVRSEEGEEKVEEKVLPLHAMLANLPISGKIRRAMLGTAAERALLVRDHNKLVATAAIRSPQIQEPEVVRISVSRQIGEEVLRVIAQNGEWMKNHQIKYNLVGNPRTPFAFAAKLILHLREHELKALERSRDVPAPVRTAAKQQLQRRGKKSGG